MKLQISSEESPLNLDQGNKGNANKALVEDLQNKNNSLD